MLISSTAVCKVNCAINVTRLLCLGDHPTLAWLKMEYLLKEKYFIETIINDPYRNEFFAFIFDVVLEGCLPHLQKVKREGFYAESVELTFKITKQLQREATDSGSGVLSESKNTCS